MTETTIQLSFSDVQLDEQDARQLAAMLDGMSTSQLQTSDSQQEDLKTAITRMAGGPGSYSDVRMDLVVSIVRKTKP